VFIELEEEKLRKEELIRRDQEAVLRLKARRLGHLEAHIRKMAGLTLASRFRMEHLLFVGGYGVLFVAIDTGGPGKPHVVVKFPFMDWSRPGKTKVSRLKKRRSALEREGILLLQGEGRILPALVASFVEDNPLIMEPTPRLASAERFVAMELIRGATPDAAARTAAKLHGRDSSEFDWWISDTLQSIADSLIQLSAQFPEMIYTDIAAKNFLLTSEKTVRVVDAGSLVPLGTPLSRASYTPKYCTLTKAERREPADEQTVVRRMAALGVDLLTDKVSLGRRPDTVLKELRDNRSTDLTDIMASALDGEISSLADFARTLRDLGAA